MFLWDCRDGIFEIKIVLEILEPMLGYQLSNEKPNSINNN